MKVELVKKIDVYYYASMARQINKYISFSDMLCKFTPCEILLI